MEYYNVIKVSDVESTNSYALYLKERKLFKQGLVIVSDFQKNGKGQRGNAWESKKGKNLIISVVIEPRILIGRQFDLTKIASLSLIDCLLSLGVQAKIKWPNDILVGNKKIAGILIQNIITGDIISHSVIGIGLNINQQIFYDYIPKATSLSLEMNQFFFVEEIQEILLNKLKFRLKDYTSGKDLDKEYLNSLFKKDKMIFFTKNSQKFNGVIRGVTDSGQLLLEIENRIRKFNLKEMKMVF